MPPDKKSKALANWCASAGKQGRLRPTRMILDAALAFANVVICALDLALTMA